MGSASGEEGALKVDALSRMTLIHLKADDLLRQDPNLNHEYLPITGLAEFTSAAQKLILGPESAAIGEGRVCHARYDLTCLDQSH